MRKILVTGSEGFVGRNLTAELQRESFEFCTLDLSPSSRSDHFEFDLCDSKLNSLLLDIGATTVIHLAAQTDVRVSMVNPVLDLEINGFGTLNLLKGALNAGCTNFIYINSGGAIYSSTAKIPFSEHSEVRPDSAYGVSKQLGEEYVRLFCNKVGSSWKSMALSNVYGPIVQNKKGIFFEAWRALSENRSFDVFGEKVTRDYVHVLDVVSAIKCAILSDDSGRFNIGTGIETANLEVFKFMAEKMNSNLEYEVQDPRPGEVLRSALDISKANSKLNWKPKIDLKSGVDKILEGLSS